MQAGTVAIWPQMFKRNVKPQQTNTCYLVGEYVSACFRGWVSDGLWDGPHSTLGVTPRSLNALQLTHHMVQQHVTNENITASCKRWYISRIKKGHLHRRVPFFQKLFSKTFAVKCYMAVLYTSMIWYLQWKGKKITIKSISFSVMYAWVPSIADNLNRRLSY